MSVISLNIRSYFKVDKLFSDKKIRKTNICIA